MVTDMTKPTAQTATKTYMLIIAAAAPPLAITTPSTPTLPGGETGILYAPMGYGVGLQFAASGGVAPYTWAITSPPPVSP